MTPKRKERLMLVGLITVAGVIAAGLILVALKDNLNAFFTPTQIAEGKAPEGRNFRMGGMVEKGSVIREWDGGLTVSFGVTDTAHTVTAHYTGILPDLFREEQGVVALGKLNGKGEFVAEEVLAKHDENYMPPEAAYAMEQAKLNKLKQQGKNNDS
jgi:cytochrome c-type biogenesis protein CcmE